MSEVPPDRCQIAAVSTSSCSAMAHSLADFATPRLLIPTSIFPPGLATNGFLTPTVLDRGGAHVRVYGGMRDKCGTSRIGWVDIDRTALTIGDVCSGPVLELGPEGSFDDDGMILGDIASDPHTGDLVMAYVGFHQSKRVKFRAFTGFALSRDGGKNFKRLEGGAHLGRQHFPEMETIVAVHTLRVTDGGWEVLFAGGSDWEFINGTPYPRYSIYAARGTDLRALEVDTSRVVENPPGLYRLGRPRIESIGESAHLIATGGRTNGDYRPYLFTQHEGRWCLKDDQSYPVFPGCCPQAQIQAAYPVHFETREGTLVLFNGDDMGRAGTLAVSLKAAS